MPQQPIAAIRGICEKQSRNNALPARVPYNNSQVTARRLASCTRKYNSCLHQWYTQDAHITARRPYR